MKNKRIKGELILFIILGAILAIYVVPILMMFLGAFKTQPEAILFDLKLPKKLMWENFSHVIQRGKILSGYKNSFLITSITTITVLIIGSTTGIILSRRSDKITEGIYYYFIFGLTITLQVASTFSLLKTLNIYGTYLSVILIFIAMRMPFTVMTFASFVKGIPREIDEAAIVDGCGTIRMIFSILMPILKPIMITNMIVTIISVWNDFNISLFFLNSSKKWTVSLTIYNFFGRYARDWQYVFAALTLTVLPIMIMYLFLQRYIVEGMTSGAVKG